MVLCCAYCRRSDEEKLASFCNVDSKKMSPARRKKVLDSIQEFCSFHWREISAAELNELMAKMSLNDIEAMVMSDLISRIKKRANIMIDLPDRYSWTFQNRMSKFGKTKFEAEHKADENYPIVSAASVYAKVIRDAKIAEIAEKIGDFGSGYAFDKRTRAALIEPGFRKRLNPFVRTRWKTLNNLMQTTLKGD
jgi:ribonuclease HII